MHQWVLRRMRLKWMRMEAVWLVGSSVKLSVKKTRWQNRVNRAVAAISTIAIGILILTDEVLIAINTAKIWSIGCQQIILNWGFSLWRVAQASRAILTRMQIVIVGLILVIPWSNQIVCGSVCRDGTRVICVANNWTRVHECLMSHLRCWRWGAN